MPTFYFVHYFFPLELLLRTDFLNSSLLTMMRTRMSALPEQTFLSVVFLLAIPVIMEQINILQSQFVKKKKGNINSLYNYISLNTFINKLLLPRFIKEVVKDKPSLTP